MTIRKCNFFLRPLQQTSPRVCLVLAKKIEFYILHFEISKDTDLGFPPTLTKPEHFHPEENTALKN